jgi:hypothetical protein
VCFQLPPDKLSFLKRQYDDHNELQFLIVHAIAKHVEVHLNNHHNDVAPLCNFNLLNEFNNSMNSKDVFGWSPVMHILWSFDLQSPLFHLLVAQPHRPHTVGRNSNTMKLTALLFWKLFWKEEHRSLKLTREVVVFSTTSQDSVGLLC